VVDGDTIKVAIGSQEYTLRYIGIDTPETVRPDSPVEWMGPEATAANETLVAGKTVYLEKDVSETDRYGRLLRYVYLADGTMVNAELVRQGYAQSSAYPPDVKHQELLDRAEREAREAGRGLWAPRDDEQSPEPGAEGTVPAATTPSPSQSMSGIVITGIHYRGAIKPNEPDEYCEIRNDGPEPVDMAGWRLNAGADGQDLIFPTFRLEPGQTCRVYTNEVHPETCGLSFGSNGAIWRNSGDCGRLYDASGTLVAEGCY
jgi:micrococcal nuclease